MKKIRSGPLRIFLCLSVIPSAQALAFHQLREESVLCDQLLIGAVLRDLSAIDHENPVAMANGAEPMGDDRTPSSA